MQGLEVQKCVFYVENVKWQIKGMSRLKRFSINLVICLVISFAYLGCYLMKMSSVLALKVKSPKLENLVRFINEDNQRLRLEEASFEDPKRLLDLKNKPEYSHLKFLKKNEVETIRRKESLK